MSAAHTPGPWSVVDGHYPGFLEIKGPSFTVSIVMSATNLDFMDYVKREADALVMAAAPELLEALTMVRDADEDCIRDHLQRMPSSARQLIDAAIAKTTGGAA